MEEDDYFYIQPTEGVTTTAFLFTVHELNYIHVWRVIIQLVAQAELIPTF